jgi:hypothetical protein
VAGEVPAAGEDGERRDIRAVGTACFRRRVNKSTVRDEGRDRSKRDAKSIAAACKAGEGAGRDLDA